LPIADVKTPSAKKSEAIEEEIPDEVYSEEFEEERSSKKTERKEQGSPKEAAKTEGTGDSQKQNKTEANIEEQPADVLSA
jgi:hypothetical protein